MLKLLMLCEDITGKVILMNIKRYSELILLPTFEERYKYLQLNGAIGNETFGFDRYINQMFYRSQEWKHVRDYVIIRDNGCDLGIEGHEIRGKILIHHMNPIGIKDIQQVNKILLDPEYLITTMLSTHNAIHYGDESLLVKDPIERSKNDTCPWKR